MAYLSETELKSYSNFVRLSETKSAQRLMQSRYSGDPWVFLSHSHKDKSLVEFTKQFLASQGVNVYVDWMDGGMPDVIGPQTAIKIREKIAANKKFILLATANALSSKWVPWELGCADGIKTSKNIAVLAVRPDGGAWSGNEYVGLYPIIESEGVREPGATGLISLRTWLARN